jgi:ABC-type transporter Mla subunit MlaD
VFAAHDADQRQFFADLDAIANQLGLRADDLTALARSLNAALPTLNSGGDNLNQLLVQTARLSNDVADLLENNTDFINKSFNQGQAVLDSLYSQGGQIVPLVSGIASYAQWLAAVVRIDLPDGSQMAAVKGLLGTQACLLMLCTGGNTLGATGPTAAGTPSGPAPLAVPGITSVPGPAPAANVISSVLDILSGLGGKR